MTALYPIGTQLITRRLSQAALYNEIFGEYDLSSYTPIPETYTDESKSMAASFIMGWMPCFYSYADEWRVTVTEENQKWLSPVPMVGDKIQYHQDPHGSVYVSNIVSFINDEILDLKADPSTDAETYETEISIYQVHDILKRTYPNGQRAPLIEFHEVLLPEGAIA
jgi:hypothetical protein